MTEVVGRGIIELVGDARKLDASIAAAKKSIRTLGEGQKDITAAASQSIDKYIGRLQFQNATLGKSARETELFKLALRGASNEQLKTADGALRLAESTARNATSLNALKTGFIAFGAIAATSMIAAVGAFDSLVKKAGDFQDMGEKIGDTAENVASLAVAAAVGGTSMQELVAASARLSKGLTGVDDESKAAGAGIEALGLDIAKFKALSPVDQIEAVAKAMAEFEDGTGKTAVAIALFGRAGAQMLPFLKELGAEGGRQAVLTSEQIRLADEYSDSQKRLATEISLHAQAIATDLLPQVTAFKTELFELVKGYESTGQASGLLNDAFDTGISLFKIIAVVAANTAFVFLAVGREIGAIAAQLVALGRLDFTGFSAISDAVKEDAVRARAEIDKLTADILNVGNKPRGSSGADQEDADRGQQIRDARKRQRGKVNFEGAQKKGKEDSAAKAEAAAQLAFDLDQIKKAGDAVISSFSNSEKIMEALRSAALVDEKNYYESKRGFITVNAATQEKALQDQIERLQKETFAGKNAAKERIDNERQVAALQAQILKVREDAVANITVTSIKEKEANDKISQSLKDATIASEAYISSIDRRNAREIAGIGQGSRFREEQAGISEIEDRLRAQQQRLEGELRRNEISKATFDAYLAVVKDTYSKEVALYLQRTDAIRAAEQSWLAGASEALNNYLEEAGNTAKQTQDAFTNAFRGLEDLAVDFITKRKGDIRSFVNSIIAEFARLHVKQNITGPLAKFFLGAISGGAGGGGEIGHTGGIVGKLPRFHNGGMVGRERLVVANAGEGIFTPEQMAAMGGGNQFNFTFSGGSPTDPQAFLAQVVPVMRAIAQNEISTQLQPGGALN